MIQALLLENSRSANIGNAMLSRGLKRLVSEDLSANISWESVPWDDFSFGYRSLESDFLALQSGADATFVSGAVTFNGREQYSIGGSRLDISPLTIQRLRSPLCAYGLSHRFWQDDYYHHSRALRTFMEAAQRSDLCLFAVRDDGTKEFLEGLGCVTAHLRVIPDPAIFGVLDLQPQLESDPVVEDYVIVSPNFEDASNRYACIGGYENAVSTLAEVIQQILGHSSLRVIAVGHSFEDTKAICGALARLQPSVAHQRVGLVSSFEPQVFPSVINLYRGASAVLAGRIHSIGACIGLQTPFMAWSTQTRIGAHMAGLGLGTYVLEFDSPPESVAMEILALAQDSVASREAINNAVLSARHRLKEFNVEVASLFNS